MRPLRPCKHDIGACDVAHECLTRDLLPHARMKFPKLRPWVVEEAVRDAVDDALRGVQRFAKCGNARGYAWKAAFHDLCRRGKHADERGPGVDPEDPTSRHALEGIETANLVETFLARLTGRNHAIFSALVEEEPLDDVGPRLGVSKRTIERRVANLRQRFKTFLEEQSIRRGPFRPGDPSPCSWHPGAVGRTPFDHLWCPEP